MLKEVYVLKDGTNIFTYSNIGEQDETDHVLSSGFLSAIQSFTLETRDDEIDFFASKSEFFIFDRLNSGHEVVTVFSSNIEYHVARAVMEDILQEFEVSEIFNGIESGMSLTGLEDDKLSEKVEDIANTLISIKYQIEAAKTIFSDEPELELLEMYDYHSDESYFTGTRGTYSDNRDFEEDQLRLRSIHRYMMKLVKAWEIGKNYKIIKIIYNRSVVVISKYRTKHTLCVGTDVINEDDILEIPFRLMSLPDYERYMKKYSRLQSNIRRKVSDQSELSTISGEAPTMHQEDTLIKAIKSIERLLNTLNIEDFSTVNIYTDNPSPKQLFISRNFTSQELVVENYE